VFSRLNRTKTIIKGDKGRRHIIIAEGSSRHWKFAIQQYHWCSTARISGLHNVTIDLSYKGSDYFSAHHLLFFTSLKL
jgi:hypothetical protein